MTTNRLVTADIYYADDLVKKAVALIYIPNKGYIELDSVSSELDLLFKTLKNSRLIMNTDFEIDKCYVKKDTIRSYEYGYVNELKNVDIHLLKKVNFEYNKQKR